MKTNYKCKYTVIEKFSQMIDRQVESNIRADDLMDSSIKDKLFELIMLRFDELGKFLKSTEKYIFINEEKPFINFYYFKKFIEFF